MKPITDSHAIAQNIYVSGSQKVAFKALFAKNPLDNRHVDGDSFKLWQRTDKPDFLAHPVQVMQWVMNGRQATAIGSRSANDVWMMGLQDEHPVSFFNRPRIGFLDAGNWGRPTATKPRLLHSLRIFDHAREQTQLHYNRHEFGTQEGRVLQLHATYIGARFDLELVGEGSDFLASLDQLFIYAPPTFEETDQYYRLKQKAHALHRDAMGRFIDHQSGKSPLDQKGLEKILTEILSAEKVFEQTSGPVKSNHADNIRAEIAQLAE